MEKNCTKCDKKFIKLPSHSNKYWATRRFCSLSCSKKDVIHLEKTREKRSISLKNFYSASDARIMLSEVRKKQWQNGFKGTTGKHWKKTNEQLKNKMGNKNPAWKGGITPINTAIRNSEQYAEWRKEVFERDDYTCQECGKRGVNLHADHIKPFAHYPDLRFVIDNGRSLCVSCHRSTPTYGGRSKNLTVIII